MDKTSPTKKFNLVWNDLSDLITDSDFGDDDLDRKDREKMIKKVLDKHGIEGTEDLFEMLCRSGENYWYSEYSDHSPGTRSSHRSEYHKETRLSKNHLRAILGIPKKGIKESKELLEFTRELPFIKTPPTKKEYGPVFIRKEQECIQSVMDHFGLSKGHAYDVVSSVRDLLVTEKRPEYHVYSYETLEEVGIVLQRLRSKK